jgi:transcriptional regulator with XRE-family HTH domain
MEHINDKLSSLASDQPSAWRTKAEFRRKNCHLLKKAAGIAQRVLTELKSKDLFQSELAGRIGASQEQISNIVKGHVNLTLETISRLEIALGIEILKVTP